MTYYSQLPTLLFKSERGNRKRRTPQVHCTEDELQKYRIQTGYRFRSVVSLSFGRTGLDRHVAAPFGGTTLEGVTAIVTGYRAM